MYNNPVRIGCTTNADMITNTNNLTFFYGFKGFVPQDEARWQNYCWMQLLTCTEMICIQEHV